VVLDATDYGTCRGVRVTAPGSATALTLLSPFDRIQPIPRNGAPRRGGRARAMAECAAALRRTHDAGQLRAAVDAHINILPYQLEPALVVSSGEASRVLLADEVGLGKTIQAGLILSELRAAGGFTRALILTPAGLREQWSRELRERFGIETVLMDAAALRALGRSLPPWVNPWTLPGVALASIDLLKRGELLPQIETVTWDAVIVDEAHHATRGTDRHAAATLACARARVAVLITATPHNGDGIAFADLRAIGALEGDTRPVRVFRRTRREIASEAAPRRVRFVSVRPAIEERALHAALDAYTSRVWRESDAAGAARLAMIVLRKRALSGPASLARSLARRLEALSQTPSDDNAQQLPLDFGDTLGGELIGDDREPVGLLSAPGLTDGTTERGLLSSLLEVARAAIPGDSKAVALTRAVTRAREAAIVFTEYRDTLEDLRRRLAGRVPLEVLHGGMLAAERVRALSAFTSGAVRLLLATDAAAEGLNLHHGCRWVIHHEAPWNPARVEQRNGRVDRLGQSRRVHVWHLVAAQTAEEDILAKLVQRSERAARAMATEAAVATAVFEGTPLLLADRADGATSDRPEAAREAERIVALRRIRHRSDRLSRPTLARVRRRGPFRHLRAGQLLAVFRADVLGGGGQRFATLAAGFEGSDLAAARAAAGEYFDKAAKRVVAIGRHVAARHGDRERAIARSLANVTPSAVQASLFDRRSLAAADHRDAELARARAEFNQRCAARAEGSTRAIVSVSLVAVFRAR
jgi:superfamily II DNA or RNA helicase